MTPLRMDKRHFPLPPIGPNVMVYIEPKKKSQEVKIFTQSRKGEKDIFEESPSRNAVKANTQPRVWNACRFAVHEEVMNPSVVRQMMQPKMQKSIDAKKQVDAAQSWSRLVVMGTGNLPELGKGSENKETASLEKAALNGALFFFP